MPRLRKLRRKQKYQYNVNRRRLNQKSKKLPQINCAAVRNAWNEKKSVGDNLSAMGLVADPNKTFRILSTKERQFSSTKTMDSKEVESEEAQAPEIVKQLEETAKKTFAEKKAIAHPLPPEMYRKLTKFIDKYGEDYEAMSLDHGNYFQETPTQLKNQITRLKKIPQQWIPYLRTRGLIETATTAPEPAKDEDIVTVEEVAEEIQEASSSSSSSSESND